ncbi:MAG: hypothetical protein CME10_12620, partial [Gemmatimonadetes bacterium]|nr:hypothetical protein [Gemmatimonadota bacterium]
GKDLLRYVGHVRLEFLLVSVICFLMFTVLCVNSLRKLSIIFPVICFFELYLFGCEFNGTISAESYKDTPATATAIINDHKEVAPPRILSLVNEKNSHLNWHSGWSVDVSSYLRYNETLRLYSGGLYGLHNSLPGWSPLHLRRQWEFATLYPGIIKTAGIQYVISTNSLNSPYLELIRDADISVYRVIETFPRAYLASKYRVIKDQSRRFSLLRRGELDLETVLLEEFPIGFKSNGDLSDQVEIVDYRDEYVRILLNNHNGGILVLSDTNYPGWRAFIDGEEAPILTANHLFRGVAVLPDAREVVFEFASDTFILGLWCTLVTGLFTLFVLYYRFRAKSPSKVIQLSQLSTQSFVFPVSLQMLLFSLVYGFVKHKSGLWDAIDRCRVLELWAG